MKTILLFTIFFTLNCKNLRSEEPQGTLTKKYKEKKSYEIEITSPSSLKSKIASSSSDEVAISSGSSSQTVYGSSSSYGISIIPGSSERPTIIPSLSNKNATVSASISIGRPTNRRCIGIGTRVTNQTRYVHWMHLVMNKPVIYLYPTEPIDISVRLSIKDSKFSALYPRFNGKNTWNVHAKPNGEISIKDKKYPYLFWESHSYVNQETNEGFVVKDEDAEKFLEEKLEILGLNEKEKTDFITYWLPVLLRNKLSICTFQTEKFFKNFELDITPKPDSLIRIFLTIKKIDAPINIKEQKLKSVERKGFTVIEWGGSNI